jgi:hypothetical protein
MNVKPNWKRIFPDGDHRWSMGLQREHSAADFFALQDPSRGVIAERRGWLNEDFGRYALALPLAEAAVREATEYAVALGTPVAAHEPQTEARLFALGVAWEPDFVLLSPGCGVHTLIAGVVCFPSSWALGEKLGRPLSEVHAPVPGLNDALGRQMELFLQKLRPGEVWRRENWGLSRDAELNRHPDRARPRLEEQVTADQVWIRLEHQLLTRLPRSGAVLFGIRVEVLSLARVLAEPAAALRMAGQLASMSEAAAAYKGVLRSRPSILALLRQAGE